MDNQTKPSPVQTNIIRHLDSKLRVAHLTANLSYTLLLLVLTWWAWTRPGGASLLLWALVCAPLLLLWPALRKRSHRAYSWLCFLMLGYFVKSVEGSFSSAANWVDYSVLVLSVIIFISAMLTSRWLQYANLHQPQEEPREAATTTSPHMNSHKEQDPS